MFSWGEVVKTDISKDEVSVVIKNYVDEKYPQKVINYNQQLKELTVKKITKIENKVFTHNGLMWQDEELNKNSKFNRLEFKVYCRNLRLANRKDWRVPRYDELISLVDYTRTNPASIDKIKYIQPAKYWSGSKSVHENKKNWFVDFNDGTSDVISDLERLHFRCVRELSSKKGTY